MLEEGSSSYNDLKYDGYMYYQEMAWEVPNSVGSGRGMLQEVPDQGYLGWACFFKGENFDERYTCQSVYAPATTNMGFGAPDLQAEEFAVSTGFRCTVENRAEFDVATCIMPMPVETDPSLYEKGEYRFSPSDEQRIAQYGFVANGNVPQNYWVPMGVVNFQNAVNSLSAGVALASLVAVSLF